MVEGRMVNIAPTLVPIHSLMTVATEIRAAAMCKARTSVSTLRERRWT